MSLLSRHLQEHISLLRFQILSFSDCSLEFERIFVFSFFKSFFYLKMSNNEKIILCNVFTFQNKKCLENLDHNGCIQICNGRIPELWKRYVPMTIDYTYKYTLWCRNIPEGRYDMRHRSFLFRYEASIHLLLIYK